jgi:hypothetical protein
VKADLVARGIVQPGLGGGGEGAAGDLWSR